MEPQLLFWYFIAAAAAALPPVFIKSYTSDQYTGWLLAAAVSYAVLIFSYVVVLQDKNITIVYPLLKVLSILMVVSAGLLFFPSSITWTTIVGIILGIISVYLLSLKL